MVIDSTGAVSLPENGTTPETRILLPQYAYFFNPTSEACEPAIVLGTAENRSFIYKRPNKNTAGAAPMVFFDLLGEIPPEAASAAAPDSVP